VCGAPNVAAGQTVAVARPGARMADGRTLGAAKLRGIVSDGMILAADELALGGDHSGILVLDEGPAPGTPLATVLRSHRRARARGHAEPPGTAFPSTASPARCTQRPARSWRERRGSATSARSAWRLPGSPVTVECPDLCPRFTARVFEDVELGPSPLWLAARLLAAGQRPISNVVDITNYVMLLTGQPMHAFDLDRVAGAELTVRRARTGETLETLDGTDPHARRGHRRDLRRRRAHLARGDHGRGRARRSARHDAGPARGGELGRRQPCSGPGSCSGCAAKPPGASRRASRVS